MSISENIFAFTKYFLSYDKELSFFIEVSMFEKVITMTSLIGLAIITKGLRRLGELCENEKNIFNAELEKRCNFEQN